MIRTLLAHDGALARAALAFVLCRDDDIEVVAQAGRYEEVAPQVRACRPQVTVLDLDLVPLADRPRLSALRCPDGGMVVLAEARQSGALRSILADPVSGVGFLAKDHPPHRLVAAVRTLASGGHVLDPDLVVSALRTSSPLTPRETEVLSAAAEGLPVAEIAARLGLSAGTVRNHLTRVMGKAGARTWIEAVRKAHDAGWI